MNIIELARKAGGADITSQGWTSWVGTQSTDFLERFAALVLKNEADETRARFAQVEQPERKWVDLTDEEIYSLAEDIDWAAGAYFSYAEAVIAAFKEKNK